MITAILIYLCVLPFFGIVIGSCCCGSTLTYEDCGCPGGTPLFPSQFPLAITGVNDAGGVLGVHPTPADVWTPGGNTINQVWCVTRVSTCNWIARGPAGMYYEDTSGTTFPVTFDIQVSVTGGGASLVAEVDIRLGSGGAFANRAHIFYPPGGAVSFNEPVDCASLATAFTNGTISPIDSDFAASGGNATADFGSTC